jgi:nucleoside-diphosphate kinase
MARQADGEVLCFLCEWFDNHAQLQRLYQLKYFSDQNEIEMFDMKSRRVFLKKSPRPEGLELKDMYLGSQVVIHSRTLTVKEYGDVYTRQKLESRRQKTILIIKPDALDYVGQIIDLVERDGFSIAKMQMVKVRLPALK